MKYRIYYGFTAIKIAIEIITKNVETLFAIYRSNNNIAAQIVTNCIFYLCALSLLYMFQILFPQFLFLYFNQSALFVPLSKVLMEANSLDLHSSGCAKLSNKEIKLKLHFFYKFQQQFLFSLLFFTLQV